MHTLATDCKKQLILGDWVFFVMLFKSDLDGTFVGVFIQAAAIWNNLDLVKI